MTLKRITTGKDFKPDFRKDKPKMVPCPNCAGRGFYPNLNPLWKGYYINCEDCNGTGKIESDPGDWSHSDINDNNNL